MICPNCGYETTGNYCNNCGAPLPVKHESAASGPLYKEDEDDFVEFELPGDEYAVSRDAGQNFRYAAEDSAGQNFRYAGKRETGQEKETPRKRVPKNQGDKSSRDKSSSAHGSSSEARSSKKEMLKKDARLKKLEGELESLRTHAEERSKSMKRMESGQVDADRSKRGSQRGRNSEKGISRSTRRNPERIADRYLDGGREYPDRIEDRYAESSLERDADRYAERNPEGNMGKALISAGVGAVVLTSRLMQIASALLMAAMTAVMLKSFWQHGQGLGDIRYVIEQRNYGLALYAGFAGVSLFMGLIWCLWILSGKGAGGGVRMKKYDTGRGFLPFLICAAVVVATGVIMLRFPDEEGMWHGPLQGARTALEAVYAHRNGLFFGSGLGAVLSFIRKLLRV